MHAAKTRSPLELERSARAAVASDRRAPLLELLEAYGAARGARALSADEAAAYASAVHAARGHWTPSARAMVPTLGRAWHLHLAADRGEEYFAHAASSDALVDRVLPDLQARVIAVTSHMLDEPAVPRVGWCGPGVEVHRAHGGRASPLATFEGRTRAQLESAARAVAFALVLDASDDAALCIDDGPRVPLVPGDVVAIEGTRAWRVEPGAGCVLARVNALSVAGHWETWF
jgi:hypothetical protein